MISAIYVGSFDPITYGHIDIINRSCRLVDKLYIAPAFNVNKKFFFTLEERKNHLSKIFINNNKIQVIIFNNLLSDFVIERNINFIIKGVRNTADFQQELTMAQMNKHLNNSCETIFLPCSPEYSYISSSLIKEIYYNNGNLEDFVPNEIIHEINNRKGNE